MADGPETGQTRRASDRGRYGRLNRERVLAAALELVDREGLSALSMRRLGVELGVEALALYRYAASKGALLDGLVEALYLELEERLAAAPRPARRTRRLPGEPNSTASPAPPTTSTSPTPRRSPSSPPVCWPARSLAAPSPC